MKIYDILLEEEACFFSNSEKVFLMLLYRKMQKKGVNSILINFNDIEKETLISKSVISKALRTAQEIGLLDRRISCINRIKKIKLTILRGL